MGPSNQNPTSYQSILGALFPTTGGPAGTSRTSQGQSEHDNLIRKQVVSYRQNGYCQIKADHISHPDGAPLQVYGHIPDLAAVDGHNRPVFCEVETTDTLGLSHTQDQLRAFRRAANDVGGSLHLVVPTAAYDYALRVLSSWNLAVEAVWYG